MDPYFTGCVRHIFILFRQLAIAALLSVPFGAHGQAAVDADTTAPRYTVGHIAITGNKKTQSVIILRELFFRAGERYSLSALAEKMETSRQQLMNTALFHQVVISAGPYQSTEIDILIEVRVRWYLFPAPYFRPVDRNLNQWLVEQHARLDRVNYGMKVSYNNATGQKDKFRLWGIGGYTRQVSFSYDRPYIDRKLKWGMAVSFARGKNREVNYNTFGDKQAFVKTPDDFIRRFTNLHVHFSYRPAIRTRHLFGIGFTSESMADTLARLNPDYFGNGRRRVGIPSLFYTMQYHQVDYIPYPTRGHAAQISVSYNGLNRHTDLAQVHIKGIVAWPLGRTSYLAVTGYGGIKLPFRQPYFNRRFLGYGDAFLQGFEYYVIDGVAGGYLKATFMQELLSGRLRLPKGIGRTVNAIPFRILAKAYGNTGRVYDPESGENRLPNRWLHAAGVGIDIVTLYDVVIRLEWSFNSIGENGLFLHRRNAF